MHGMLLLHRRMRYASYAVETGQELKIIFDKWYKVSISIHVQIPTWLPLPSPEAVLKAGRGLVIGVSVIAASVLVGFGAFFVAFGAAEGVFGISKDAQLPCALLSGACVVVWGSLLVSKMLSVSFALTLVISVSAVPICRAGLPILQFGLFLLLDRR